MDGEAAMKPVAAPSGSMFATIFLALVELSSLMKDPISLEELSARRIKRGTADEILTTMERARLSAEDFMMDNKERKQLLYLLLW